jgi:hypothetical protein
MANGVLTAITQDALRQREEGSKQFQQHMAQFSNTIGQARQMRQQREAAIQMAEGELAGLRGADGVSDEEMSGMLEAFASGNKKQQMEALAELQGLKARFGMQQEQKKFALDEAFKQQQIAASQQSVELTKEKLEDFRASEALGADIRSNLQAASAFAQGEGAGVYSPQEQERLGRFISSPVNRQLAIEAPNLTDSQLAERSRELFKQSTTPGTRAPIIRNVQQPDGTLRITAFDPVTLQPIEDMGRAEGAPRTYQTREQIAEAKTEEERQSQAADFNKATIERGSGVVTQLVAAKRLKALLAQNPDKPLEDLETGTFTKIQAAWDKMLLSAGMEDEAAEIRVAKAEEFRSIAGRIALSFIQQTKGAVSDKEMTMFEQMSPSLTATRRGNEQMLDFVIKAGERDRKLARKINEWRQDEKNYPKELDVQIAADEWIEENDLSELLMTEEQKAGATTPPPQANQPQQATGVNVTPTSSAAVTGRAPLRGKQDPVLVTSKEHFDKLQTLVNNTGQTIVAVDSNGVVRTINKFKVEF